MIQHFTVYYLHIHNVLCASFYSLNLADSWRNCQAVIMSPEGQSSGTPTTTRIVIHVNTIGCCSFFTV